MREYLIEREFEYKHFRCVIVFLSGCYRCGYVEIPTNTYKKSDLLNIQCHGGITHISNELNIVDPEADKMWIGFDCHHKYDGLDFNTGRDYFKDKDNINFMNDMEMLQRTCEPRHIMSLENCIFECKNIVNQLIELRGNK